MPRLVKKVSPNIIFALIILIYLSIHQEMRYCFVFLFSIVLSLQLSAQVIDFDDYKRLVTVGKLPEDVTLKSSVKYKNEMERILKKESGKDAKDKSQFIIETRFQIDEILRSGYVLFNDPIGAYVNEVADKTFAHDQNLRDKIRVYILRTADVNAFSTDQGIIFITLGMLAQLENEAQLAFVLCHEIVHFEEKHGLKLSLKRKDYDKTSSKDVYGSGRLDRSSMLNRYSRDHETEADLKGFEYFIKTGYDLSSIDGVFDVLSLSHLPFIDEPFDYHFFEDSLFKFTKLIELDSVFPITMNDDEDEDDEDSSHPSTAKRRKAISEKIANQTKVDKSKFLVSESRFKQMQQVARFETIGTELHEQEYHRSMYEAYALMHAGIQSKYLQKSFCKGLYVQTKLTNNGDFEKVNKSNLQGEFHRFDHFFTKLNDEEYNIFAIRYIWQQRMKYPDDVELKEMSEDVLYEFIFHHDSININWFDPASILPAPNLAAVDSAATADIEVPLTKADKARKNKTEPKSKKKKKKKDAGLPDYWKAAFADFQNEEAFKTALAKCEKRAADRRETIEAYKSDEAIKKRESEAKYLKNNGKALGIDKMLVFNPVFVQINTMKKAEKRLNLIENEANEAIFSEVIQASAEKLKMDVVIYDGDNLGSDDAETLNDICVLNEWFKEQIKFEDLSVTNGFRQEEVRKIAEKHNVDYVCFTGVIAVKKPVSGMAALLLVLYVMPYGIYKVIKGDNELLYYNVIYNLKTGSYETVYYKTIKSKYEKLTVQALTYDAFNQIHTPKRKKK